MWPARQEPVRLQAEQEGEALSRHEAADVEAALLLSLQEGEEAASDDVDLEAAPSDDEQSEEEEEEKQAAPAAPGAWHTPVLREPPRMARHVAVGAPMHDTKGAVYVFKHAADGSWSQETSL